MLRIKKSGRVELGELIVLSFVLCWFLTGCIVTGRNQGEFGFRSGTELTWFHRTAQTADVESVSQISTTLISGPLLGGDTEPTPTP